MIEQIPHTGQWRLSCIEVVNWGTFNGHHTLPVSREGLLITGRSGSGKSTLLDAIATAMTPPAKRHFNAAAKSEGVKGEDRTLASYIRGAYCHATADSGEITNVYLRPKAATWSGILLRFENGMDDSSAVDEPIDLIVLMHMKANSYARDGISILYAVLRGDHHLPDLAAFIQNGKNLQSFNKALSGQGRGKGYSEFSPYAEHFCRMFGIPSTKALDLLHKTQAAKNFGSLDDLFRKFMLDEPETRELADAAIEQFNALNDAHRGVVDQRLQLEMLSPLEKIIDERNAIDEQAGQIEGLQAKLRTFTSRMAIDLLLTELEDIHRQADESESVLRAAEREYALAEQELDQVNALLSSDDAITLSNADLGVAQSEKAYEDVMNARDALLGSLSCMGVEDIPVSESEFAELKRSAEALLEAAQKDAERGKAENAQHARNAGRIEDEMARLDAELRNLRGRATNIPVRHVQVRDEIARVIGLESQDLPFFGEMLDVKEADKPWQGALERLIGGQAKLMLVPHRFANAVSRYANDHHLGIRFEYESVSPDVEVPDRRLDETSSVRKLVIFEHQGHPELTRWVNRELRTRFDYHCVESMDEMMQHRYALTQEGLIRRGSRFVKNDRYDVTDRTHWLLGTSNDAKIGLLEEKARRLREELSCEKQAIEDALSRIAASDDVRRACSILEKANWPSYDLDGAKADLQSAQEHRQLILSANKDLESLAQRKSESETRVKAARSDLNAAILDRDGLSRKTKEKEEEIENHRSQIGATDNLDGQTLAAFSALFESLDANYMSSLSSIYQTSNDASQKLSGQMDALRKNQSALEGKVMRIQAEYRSEWPAQAANLGSGFEDVDGYVSILRRIRSSGLPQYEMRFLEVLTEFSQDRVTALSTAIRRASREVREKLIPVNDSLRMSEYAPGVHLVIEVRDSRSSVVLDFLADLKRIMEGTWSEDDIESAEERFRIIEAVVSRLSSSEYADRVWRDACLDTRKHMAFIAKEVDEAGEVCNIHSSDVGLSGGQKQKLVIFCLAAALRYQLSSEHSAIPRYGTVVLDEAFDKADRTFAKMAMGIFEVFGFHMVLATPEKLLKALEDHVGQMAYVHCEDGKSSHVSSVLFEDEEHA